MTVDGTLYQWRRPDVPPFDPKDTPIAFQNLECDFYVGPKLAGSPLNHLLLKHKQVPIVRFYGVTKEGYSVLCHVHGFFPYFYIPAPSQFQPHHCETFTAKLNEKIPQSVIQITCVQKQSIYGYHGPHRTTFLKILVSHPKLIAPLKRLLETSPPSPFTENNNYIPAPNKYQTYESNLEYTLRLMIDKNITGAGWIELRQYTRRTLSHESTESSHSSQSTVPVVFTAPANDDPLAVDSTPPTVLLGSDALPSTNTVVMADPITLPMHSHAQIEIDCFHDDLIAHAIDDGEWGNVAPLRILSFDIECAGRKGIFPEPEIDPVIQIANLVTLQGEKKPLIRNVFTLGTCAPIVGVDIHSFEREEELLAAWQQFVSQVDPDVITGYNINQFDFPYLIARAQTLKVPRFPFLGRLRDVPSEVKETTFSSKAYGTREAKSINMEGRWQFDLLQVMQRDYKLRSYTLNAVSAHFLNEQKEDVHHSIITQLQQQNDESRRRLAVYCLKDATLPQKLLDKLMCLVNYMEMARVTGVPFNYLLTRGQQIKVISQLFRKANQHHLLIPAMRSEGVDEEYEGATVIDPMKGYYDVPIATLDFSSLYPSIMMAHNLCYSTLLDPKDVALYQLSPDAYIKTPSNDLFVKAHLHKGLLPEILEDLLSARKRAKRDLALEQDAFRRAVLDGRQLALKISANSVYGFTGATVGKLPCLQISQSVTAFGRQMIETTRSLIERTYTIAAGYDHDAVVIYGDTDSVMIKFGTQDMQRVFEMGRAAAQRVSAHFVQPIRLEFEKVYFPYLLINKKRYAGLYWSQPTQYDKMDCKGIETVRRDNCPLVKNVIDTCLRKILIERDVPGSIEYVKRTISDLLQNRIDMSELVITKALSKLGEDYAGKQAHVELAERMRQRDAGSAPNRGDRVPYVIIKGAKGAAAYEKAEDPIYVLDNNIPIDTKYYLDNQLAKPLQRLFDPILGDSSQQMLLAGEHTRSITVTTPTVGGLMKFAVKTQTCLGCKAPMKAGSAACCGDCKSREAELYQRQLRASNELEERFSRLWTQCQRCQGSLHQDVICTNRDCPIFYMRKKVQKDLDDAHEVVSRFHREW